MTRGAATSPVAGKRRGRGTRAAARRRAGTLVLRWGLSRRAAAMCGVAAARGAGGPVLELRVAWVGVVREGGITAAVVDGGVRREVAAAGGGTWVQEAGLWHLDAGDVVSVSLREEEGRIRVLYARSAVPARLGLEGGRYEFEGGALLPA